MPAFGCVMLAKQHRKPTSGSHLYAKLRKLSDGTRMFPAKNTELSFLVDEASVPFKPFAHFRFPCAADNNLRMIVSFEADGHLPVLEALGACNLSERDDVLTVHAHEKLRIKQLRNLVEGLWQRS